MENTKEFILENKEFSISHLSEEQTKISLTDTKGGIKSLEVHKSNPFMKDTIVHVDRGYKKIKIGTSDELANIETGEVQQGQFVFSQVSVDRGTFVKIFADQIDKIYDLPRPARKLFEYITINLQPNNDEIYIHHEEVMEVCGYKQLNQVIKALVILAKKGIISRSYRPYWWFINPTILFNGNRLVLVTEYILKSKEDDKEWESNMKKTLNADNDED